MIWIKCHIVFHSKTLQYGWIKSEFKISAFFITDSHDADIYKTLKEAGVIIGNVDELFGEQYSHTIKGILNLIENAGAILKTNPWQYLSLLENIEKLAIGKTNNLKGDLFEMTVGFYHGQLYQSLEIGKNIFMSKTIEK